MKKIILKCKLKDSDSLEEKLSKIGLDFGPVYWQHDRIYAPVGYKRGLSLPRLIVRTNVYAIDYPPQYSIVFRRHIEESGIDIVEETQITDYVGMVNIIMQLGFEQIGEVSLRRQQSVMDDKTIFSLDTIDELGPNATQSNNQGASYVKFEATLDQDESADIVKEDLRRTLGLFEETDITNLTYLEIVNQKNL